MLLSCKEFISFSLLMIAYQKYYLAVYFAFLDSIRMKNMQIFHRR